MKAKGVSLSAAVFVAMFALLASAANAQTYGPLDQVLTIGAAEFRSRVTYDTDIGSDGYVYYSGDSFYRAPLSLPEGASIERLCLYANDADPGGEVTASLLAVKLVPGGESPYFLFVGPQTTSDSDIGYGYYCTNPFSYTLRGTMDIDDDGVIDAVAYYVSALVPPPSQNSLGLGGVRISWHREVSDPPPAPTFADVQPGDPGFPYIEALAASGITAGCAGGNYCPDANLTRRQMAVFLAKALGLHWEN